MLEKSGESSQTLAVYRIATTLAGSGLGTSSKVG